MIKKIIIILFCVVFLFSCSQFALVASGGSLVLSQNSLTKAYNSMNMLTVITTKKDIKTHIKNTLKNYGR